MEVIYEHEAQRYAARVEDRVAVAGFVVETRRLSAVDAEDTVAAVASDGDDNGDPWDYAYEEEDVEDKDTSLAGHTGVDIVASWAASAGDSKAGRRGEGACSAHSACLGGWSYTSHHAAEEGAAWASGVVYRGGDDFAAY